LFCLVLARSATADVLDGRLGSRCGEQEACGETGLLCLGPDSTVFAGGPAGGLCTAPCLGDTDCHYFDASATCAAGVCFEGCTLSTALGGELDGSKCHGRDDLACTVFCTDSSCADIVGGCIFSCATDDQCGEGLFCNRGTGLCQASPLGSEPIGSPCDLLAVETTCQGSCVVHPDAGSVGLTAGICAESCTLGAMHACGADAEDRRIACLGSPGSYGIGDQGRCWSLCDCSSECLEDERCERTDFGGRFDALGICNKGPRFAGAQDCLAHLDQDGAGTDCPDGPVRACETATCLGTAECLPDGRYSDCRCLNDDASGGAQQAGDDLPTARESSRGCQVAFTRGQGELAALLGWLALGVLARRARRRDETR
jgi:hypothetical protein